MDNSFFSVVNQLNKSLNFREETLSTKDKLAILDKANVIAQQGTCLRAKVGCIVTDCIGNVLSFGYNSAPHRKCTCEEHGCHVVTTINENGEKEENCVRTVHAEQHAIINAAKNGITIPYTSVFWVTHSPCPICLRMIIQLGVRSVYYSKPYKLDNIQLYIDNYDIKLINLTS